MEMRLSDILTKGLLPLILAAAALFSCRPDSLPLPEEDGPWTSEYRTVYCPEPDWDGTRRADLTYQLLVYSFADSDGDGWGDFRGIADRLDYLDDLGVSALWLSPVHPSMSYHGYDVLDYTGVNPRFGTMDDFRNLVEAAHGRGIRIYLDYVLNHTGREHPWFRDAVSSEESPCRDYYVFSENPAGDIAAGKIPMIATEGAGGYDSGQWFAIANTEPVRYRFDLDWRDAATPTLTVTPTDEPADPEHPGDTGDEPRYLYAGDPAACHRFYANGDGTYSLVLDFSSPWGLLIRTSDDDAWPAGTKYGARDAASSQLKFGEPFPLYHSTDNNAVSDIRMPGGFFFHSHFWTDWFADLNYGPVEQAESSPAFRALTEAARFWVDAGIDGMRLDAVKHIYHNERSDENPVFLDKFYRTVNGYYRERHGEDIYMVGEVLSDQAAVAPYYRGLPALFEFSFWWTLRDRIGSGKGRDFASTVLSWQEGYRTYRDDFIAATKLSNHDEVRTATDLGGSAARAALAGAVLLTAGGSPYIYYGEELGYLGDKSSGDEYVRAPMYWGDGHTARYTDKVDPTMESRVGSVAVQSRDTASFYAVYRRFARGRQTFPALARGRMEPVPALMETAPEALAAWYRTVPEQRVLVLHNFSAATVSAVLDDELGEALLCNGRVLVKREPSGAYRVMMEACSSAVFELNEPE